jgi:ABC-type transport system involved in multi-copper enzyme maturation permease subunit
MHKMYVIAQKEITDAFKSRRILALILILSIAMFASVWIGSIGFGARMRDYNAYLSALPASMRSQALKSPQLFPLTLLRAGIEFLEILGALLAFLIGYSSIARERSNGTNLLLLSRPVSKLQILWGKLLGLTLLWAGLLAVNLLAATIAILTIGNARLVGVDYLRLVIAFGAAEIYLVFWTLFALVLTGRLSRIVTSLFIGISTWVTVVLVLPQIGDTMDPDNQVPGGLFATLAIPKGHELTVMSHFHYFDVIRNAIEVSSITKLFERIAFAFLGIKDKYNQLPLKPVFVGMNTSFFGIILMMSILVAVAVYVSRSQLFLGRKK